jgi:DNA invertase Pin-like site-specific DNA recombinase
MTKIGWKNNMKKRQKRCVIFARGNMESVERQLRSLKEYAEDHQFKVIGNLCVLGSANAAATGTAIESIVKRKKKSDDFDVLVISDLSRLTRASVPQAAALMNRIADAGITVMAPTPTQS